MVLASWKSGCMVSSLGLKNAHISSAAPGAKKRRRARMSFMKASLWFSCIEGPARQVASCNQGLIMCTP